MILRDGSLPDQLSLVPRRLRPLRRRTSDDLLRHKGVSGERIISARITVLCSLAFKQSATFPNSTIEASVAGERSGKLLHSVLNVD